VIASSAFFVLDAILDWPVSLYDGSWSQWGQMSGSSANGGTLRSDSPWRTDIPSLSDLVVYNFDTTAGPVVYTAATGTVLNDMAAGGTFIGTANRSYRVQIDAVGTPDTFRWSQDGGTTWSASGVAITGSAQAVGAEGMTVTFTNTTGHFLNDQWDFITKRQVELLSLDGGSCSGRLNFIAPNTYEPTGCTPIPPESQAVSANQIEEEDAGYLVGGTGGGGGGGSPIAPGY
jgi:hypothetical protein